jgi:hypothetical protein
VRTDAHAPAVAQNNLDLLAAEGWGRRPAIFSYSNW